MKHTSIIFLNSAVLCLGAPSQANEREYQPEDWPAVVRCQQALQDWEDRESLFPELSCEELVASARPGNQHMEKLGSQRAHSDE